MWRKSQAVVLRAAGGTASARRCAAEAPANRIDLWNSQTHRSTDITRRNTRRCTRPNIWTVNEYIASGAAVRTETMGVEEAAARYDLSRVPEGASQVRIVHVGSFDSCPCVGAHVADTGEIPPVRIVSSDWADGVLRVRFKFVKR